MEVFFWVLIGFGAAIGGGYMRYLSTQTIRVGNSVINNTGDRERNSQLKSNSRPNQWNRNSGGKLKSNSVQTNQSYSQIDTKNGINENIIFDEKKILSMNFGEIIGMEI
tara:strand:- start:229 stop:555 length:327 start_codon:yes stop_codon:yes gene_type:complete